MLLWILGFCIFQKKADKVEIVPELVLKYVAKSMNFMKNLTSVHLILITF